MNVRRPQLKAFQHHSIISFGPFIVQNTKPFDFEANKNYFFNENQQVQMKFKGSKLAGKIENRNVPFLRNKSMQILHLKYIFISVKTPYKFAFLSRKLHKQY